MERFRCVAKRCAPLFGNRGIYHKGWTAVTKHGTPWVLKLKYIASSMTQCIGSFTRPLPPPSSYPGYPRGIRRPVPERRENRRASAVANNRVPDARVSSANKAAERVEWAIEAIRDYNPEPDLDKIKAKVLLINDAEDHANPPGLGTVERAMKQVKHGRYVLIPAGPNTTGISAHFYAELWKPHLAEFIKTVDPPLTAAAE